MLSHNNSRLVYPQDKHFIVVQQFFEAVLFQRYIIIGFIGFVDYTNHFSYFLCHKDKNFIEDLVDGFSNKTAAAF